MTVLGIAKEKCSDEWATDAVQPLTSMPDALYRV